MIKTLWKLQVAHLIKENLIGLGNKVKKTPFQKQMQKLKDRIGQEKDKNIKQELRKGNIITIIDSTLDY